MLMAAMMILALAVATGLLLERRMAGNFGDNQLALQRSQLAGRWAGYWLLSRTENPLDAACSVNCGPTPPIFETGLLPQTPEYEDAAWWQLSGEVPGVDPITGDVRASYALSGVEDARWVIEELHLQPLEGFVQAPGEPEPTLGYYRILARGSGRYPGSVAVTETVLARPWVNEVMPAPFPPDSNSLHFCKQVSSEIACGNLSWRRIR